MSDQGEQSVIACLTSTQDGLPSLFLVASGCPTVLPGVVQQLFLPSSLPCLQRLTYNMSSCGKPPHAAGWSTTWSTTFGYIIGPGQFSGFSSLSLASSCVHPRHNPVASKVKSKMAMLAGTAADEHHEQFAGIEVLAKQIATARGQERHSIFTPLSIQKDRGL